MLTRDRLTKWNMVLSDDRCVLCGKAAESVAHLFFTCDYSRELCRAVATCVSVQNIPVWYSDWVHWITHFAGRNTIKAKVVVAAVAGTVSLLWKERNARVHGAQGQGVDSILFRIKREVTMRVLGGVAPSQILQAKMALKLA